MNTKIQKTNNIPPHISGPQAHSIAPESLPGTPSLATEQPRNPSIFYRAIDASNTSSLVQFPGLDNLREASELIKFLITRPTVLNFFWATGTDNPEFKARIGGSRAKAFKCYTEALLSMNLENLTIRFTIDESTQKYNQSWLEHMKNEYGDRFQIYRISTVQENLTNKFPKYKTTIDIFFENATGGNPVLLSDFFRLVGMKYGFETERTQEIQNTLYTYCDIDAFCFGLEAPLEISKRCMDFQTMSIVDKMVPNINYNDLIRTLFEDPVYIKPRRSLFFESFDPSTTFYMGRKKWEGSNNNDLIKLQLKNEQSYVRFCSELLSKWTRFIEQRAYEDIARHFIALQKCAKSYSQYPSEENFTAYLQSTTPVSVRQIMYFSGPGFVDTLEEPQAFTTPYPPVCDWGWHGSQLIDDQKSNLLDSQVLVNTEEKEIFLAELEYYVQHVHNAFYIIRMLGRENLFSKKLLDYLSNNFPFANTKFTNLVCNNYKKLDSKIPLEVYISIIKTFGQNRLTNELPETMETQKSMAQNPFSVRLCYTLKKLGVEVPSWDSIFEAIDKAIKPEYELASA